MVSRELALLKRLVEDVRNFGAQMPFCLEEVMDVEALNEAEALIASVEDTDEVEDREG